MLKRNSIFLNVGQSMSFNGPIIHICAFRLSVWKLFVPILGSIALQISQNILFSLPSNLSHLYFPSMPPGNLHVFFLVEAGVSDAVLLSLSLIILIIAFLQRKSTVGLVLVSVSTYFGSCFNSPKKNR